MQDNVHRETGRRYTLTMRLGVCINPLLESCCNRFDNDPTTRSDRTLTTRNAQGGHQPLIGAVGGIGKPYSRYREKCCHGETSCSSIMLDCHHPVFLKRLAFASSGGKFNSLSQYTPIGEESPTLPKGLLPPEPTITSFLDDWCPCLAAKVELLFFSGRQCMRQSRSFRLLSHFFGRSHIIAFKKSQQFLALGVAASTASIQN